MKKTIVSIISIIVLLISSCESFLDTEPTGQLSVRDTYATEGGIQIALNGLYLIFNESYYGAYGGVKVYGITPASIRYITYLQETSGDDLMIRNTTNPNRVSIDNYTHDADNENVDRIYFSGFRGIKDCNSFLDNAEISPVNNEEFLSQVKAEARAIRAFVYFTLVRSYGDLPIIKVSLPRESYARDNYAELYKEVIIPDLEYASEYLQDAYDGMDRGRITKGGAQAMLAEVYLTLAGRIYDYTGVVDGRTVADVFQLSKAQLLQKSKETLENIIANPAYDLHPDYKTLFTKAGNYSKESIWEIPKDGNQMVMELLPPSDELPLKIFPGDSTKTYRGLWPRIDPATGEVISVYGWGRYVMTPNLQVLFDTLYDTRLKTVIEVEIPNPDIGGTTKFWYSSKYADSTVVYEQLDSDPRSSRAYYKLIRFANVLLMYAEVENELNNGPTASAIEALQRVQKRAYRGNEDKIPAAPSDYAGFKLSVENERRKELYFEGYRWYDLVRTGKLKEMVEAAPYGPFGTKYPTVEEKHYLFPIPNKAFRYNTDYLGKQNPGW